jgi:hypothetical protein
MQCSNVEYLKILTTGLGVGYRSQTDWETDRHDLLTGRYFSALLVIPKMSNEYGTPVRDDKRQQERVVTDGMWQEPIVAEENRK